ncbi:MAG: ribulose-phosphate 3-epimerase [Acidobacteria bacterium]|nr:ribulose-phosphate 3-epimerase [Acidobacteriota bacterium]
MPQIAPSILAADFAHLGDAVENVSGAGVEMLHVDVMDGRFVPNISIGMPVVASLRKATDLFLDCHLMIVEPDLYVADFVKAGAQNVTVHQEACPHLHRSLQGIRALGAGAGVAINPATPVSTLEYVLDMVDLVLVMSVNPGFGGQKFLPLAYDKIRELAELREQGAFSFRIEVDGGVGLDNAEQLCAAGADILVAGSSIFGTPDPAQSVTDLKARSEQARMTRV